MNRETLFGAALIGVFLSPLLAIAGIVTPISSNRTVSVTNRENLPTTTHSVTGPTTGSWQATAAASNLNFSDPNFNFNGSLVVVTSSQQSTFSADGVSFSGFVFIDYTAVLAPNLGVSGSNRCDTVFHVEGSCRYDFQATIASNNVSETQGSIFLRDNATAQNIFALTATGSQSGTLPTGDYTLSILIQGSSGGSLFFDGRTQIDALFTIPAPAAVITLAAPALWCSRRRRR